MTWTLLVDVWISSYCHGRSFDSQLLANEHSPVPPFNQMLLQAEASNGVVVNRILFWNLPQTSLMGVTKYPSNGEIFLQGDNAPRPTGCGANWSFPEWHSLTQYGYSRLIFRKGEIHCAQDYSAVGGQRNNPTLGQWGRIFIRLVGQHQIDYAGDIPNSKDFLLAHHLHPQPVQPQIVFPGGQVQSAPSNFMFVQPNQQLQMQQQPQTHFFYPHQPSPLLTPSLPPAQPDLLLNSPSASETFFTLPVGSCSLNGFLLTFDTVGFDWSLIPGPGFDPNVGRHGGVIFSQRSSVTHRDSSIECAVDFIDREKALRVYGAAVTNPELPMSRESAKLKIDEPPVHWSIQIHQQQASVQVTMATGQVVRYDFGLKMAYATITFWVWCAQRAKITNIRIQQNQPHLQFQLQLPTNPVQTYSRPSNEWFHGLFSCFESPCTLLRVLLFYPFVVCNSKSALDGSSFCDNCCCFICNCVPCFYRTSARMRYGIPGSKFGDFFISLLFPLCSAVQIERHRNEFPLPPAPRRQVMGGSGSNNDNHYYGSDYSNDNNGVGSYDNGGGGGGGCDYGGGGGGGDGGSNGYCGGDVAGSDGGGGCDSGGDSGGGDSGGDSGGGGD